jgi:hypothetical protein
MLGRMKAVRTMRTDVPFDLHPLRYTVALVLFLLFAVALPLVLFFLFLVKVIPITYRALSNHVRATLEWGPFPCYRGFNPKTALLYYLLYIALPIMALLLLPASLLYGLFEAARAALAMVRTNGTVVAGFAHAGDVVSKVDRETNKYILGKDVPFAVLPSAVDIHLPWVLAAVIPFLAGLVFLPPLLMLAAIVGAIPVVASAMKKIVDVLCYSSKGVKPYYFPFLLLFLFFVPVIALVGVFCVALSFFIRVFFVFVVVNRHRRMRPGFEYLCGLTYRCEYTLNKFAYATFPGDMVHWASCLPPIWALYAQPYMHPDDFDAGPEASVPVSIVGKPARYIPRGTRRPKYDASGNVVVDMTGAGYEIPGVGIAPIQEGGALGPVIPKGDVGATAAPTGTAAPAAPAAATTAPSAGAVPKREVEVVRRYPCCLCFSANLDEDDDYQMPPAATADGSDAASARNEAAVPSKAPLMEEYGAFGFNSKVTRSLTAPKGSGAAHSMSAESAAAADSSAAVSPTGVSVSIPSTQAQVPTTYSLASSSTGQPKTTSATVNAGPSIAAGASAASSAQMQQIQQRQQQQQQRMTSTVIHVGDDDDDDDGEEAVGVDRSLRANTGNLRSAQGARRAAGYDNPYDETYIMPDPEPHALGGGAAARLSEQQRMQAASVPAFRAPLQPWEQNAGGAEGDDEDDGDDDDEEFVLAPVVRSDLPDTWVAVRDREGEVYFVNYARNQSAWRLPPGF